MGLAIPEAPGDEWWDGEAPRLLERAVAEKGVRFDAIIVDEAQDFAPPWVAALDACSSSPGESPYYLFTDSHQQIYRRGDAAPASWPVVELDQNCRNTLPIARTVSSVYQDPPPGLGAHGRDPVFIDSEAGEEASLVQSVVDRLITEEHLKPSQVAVLCERREVVERLGDLVAGGFPFVPLGYPGVLVETVHRFKGLEADVVVLAISSFRPDDAVLYVGLSRARSMLMVVAPRSLRGRLAFR